ncbi:hypothetical protein GJAV_G00272920 [Gymnothorax javanicus]|nr:hypothetical protein GJAV_G00272920 [Gymnothorax javanicus]
MINTEAEDSPPPGGSRDNELLPRGTRLSLLIILFVKDFRRNDCEREDMLMQMDLRLKGIWVCWFCGPSFERSLFSRTKWKESPSVQLTISRRLLCYFDLQHSTSCHILALLFLLSRSGFLTKPQNPPDLASP